MTLPPAHTIDARGHKCPVPSLRLRKALADQPPGARVLLLATDPMARIDVPFLMADLGGAVLSVEDGPDGELRLLVEAGPGA